MKTVINIYRGGIMSRQDYVFEKKATYQETCIDSLNKLYRYLEKNCSEDIEDLKKKEIDSLISYYKETREELQDRADKLMANSQDNYIMIAMCNRHKNQIKRYSEAIEKEQERLKKMVALEKRLYKFYANMWSWYGLKLEGIDEFLNLIYTNKLLDDEKLKKQNTFIAEKKLIQEEIKTLYKYTYQDTQDIRKKDKNKIKTEYTGLISIDGIAETKKNNYFYSEAKSNKKEVKTEVSLNDNKMIINIF